MNSAQVILRGTICTCRSVFSSISAHVSVWQASVGRGGQLSDQVRAGLGRLHQDSGRDRGRAGQGRAGQGRAGQVASGQGSVPKLVDLGGK